MKSDTLLVVLLTLSTAWCSAQNLISNGDFESPGMGVEEVPAPWGGFKNRIVSDTITNSFVGQVENGDGSLFQEFDVTAGKTYTVVFDYRWVTSGSANSTMVIRVKNADDTAVNLDLINGTTSNGFALDEAVDQWFTGATFSFIPPEGVSSVRLLFFKANGNRPLNLDNVSVTEETTSSLAETRPFAFSAGPNPATTFLQLSADEEIEWVELYAATGELVRRQLINSLRARLEVSDLPRGLYIVKAYREHRVGAYKLLVQ